ncbi:MAG TPA: Ig domain-containing protein, partial [Syntrophomonas sp.]|nr:Ig domain-containing protein [Syntrophomonas sp.]
LPNGFTINETTGIISGTTAVAGEHRIRVTVHLPGDSRTFSHMLFFYILEPLNIDTPSLPQGTVNTEYCYSLESHGGMLPYPFHDECTWTASGLPSGLNINESTGVIYGVPSEDGTFAVTIGLLDSEGNYASKQLDLIIADAIATDACFIATAAYGSIYQHPVVLLRQFRDRFLLTNSWGQAFVNFYYHNSPPIAQFIADSEFLKRLTRAVLSPAILAVFIIFHPVWGLFLLSLFICIAYLWRIRQKKCLHY